MKEVPKYVGRFKVKEELTRKLNYGSWIIYRDPENGIYLYNPELDEEINPLLWNVTSKGWSEKMRKMLISDIDCFMKTYRPVKDLSKKLYIKVGEY